MYALKFISGKYQGGEFPVKPGKQIVVGRSSDLDMVLVEDMVSRKHAKITCTDGKIIIEDLGSTNGTFVNGEKIKQARLKEGDRVLIGTSILKLVAQGNSPQMDDQQVKKRLEEAAAAARQTRSSSMTGKIEEVPLPDLLQLFGTSKKNGVLFIKDKHEGRIYLRQGRIYYASIDDNHDIGPLKSFYRIIRWEVGDFELLPPDPQDFMIELEEPTEALLMEGLRQLDELRRIAKELPDPDARLTLAMPLNAPLRDLSPEQLDMLQLVYNTGTMQAVIDKADGSDLEASQLLLELLKKEYIQIA
ncbi:MAG: FHA domain-containing protein [Myxococcales bacterium]|jgi:pSer/pThr/pTyr-binding forkhead associated (FHA) protein